MRMSIWILIFLTVVIISILVGDSHYWINQKELYLILETRKVRITGNYVLLLLLVIFFIFDVFSQILIFFSSVKRCIFFLKKRYIENQNNNLINKFLLELLHDLNTEKLEEKLFNLSHSIKSKAGRVFIAQFCAREAHLQGRRNECEQMMRAAKENSYPNSFLLRKTYMLSASFLLDQGQGNEALKLLNDNIVRKVFDNNLKYLLLRAAILLRNHADVIFLVRNLMYSNAISKEYGEILLNQSGSIYLYEKINSGFDCSDVWHEFKGEEHFLPDIVLTAANAFESVGKIVCSSRILEKAIEARFERSLIEAYACCVPTQAIHRILKAEKWLKKREETPELLTTLGILCLNAKLWGKSEYYFLCSLKHSKKQSVIHSILKQVYYYLDYPEKAQNQLNMISQNLHDEHFDSFYKRNREIFLESENPDFEIYRWALSKVGCQNSNFHANMKNLMC